LPDQAIGARVEHRLIEESILGIPVAVRERTVTLSRTVKRRARGRFVTPASSFLRKAMYETADHTRVATV
jgi:hypothetical protein